MSGGVKKIAQVAVGAVIGFIQGGPVGAAIGAGIHPARRHRHVRGTRRPVHGRVLGKRILGDH